MLSLWVVLGVLFVTGVASGNFYNASACYGRPGCDRMTLACPDSRRIFMFQTLYGGKTPNSPCSNNMGCGQCCQIELTDCFSNFSNYTFSLVYLNHTCWNSTSCRSHVANGVPCGGYTYVYAAVYYSCLSNGEITDFHQSVTISAPAVAVRFEKTGATQYSVGTQEAKTWHCQVDTDDCVQRQADVILVKGNYTGNSSSCSSVGWSGGSFLPCVPDFQYTSFSNATPFSVSVNVTKSGSNPVGWAVVRTQDGSNLNVTCGYTDSSSIPSPCSGDTTVTTKTTTMTTSTTMTTTTTTTSTTTTTTTTTAATTTTPTTTPVQPNPTQWSSHSTNTSSSSTTPTPVSKTTSSSTTKSSASQELTSPSAAAAGSNNIGPLAGGVAAAVVVLVAAALAVFCFVRRRKQKPSEDGTSSSNRKLSLHMLLTSAASGSPSPSQTSESGIPNHLGGDDGDYDRIGHGPRPQNANAALSGTHGKPRSPAEDPDYDLLGQKKSQSSSSNPATTYGHLGEVGGRGEDTDYNYDHLAKGRQAAPDVINSDYDTSALHVTSEGDYNVAGIPKKQHVITGSDYDVAQIVTSEGDYNRVDFQGKKQRVITGSDYDSAEIVTSEGDYNRVDFQGKKQRVITGSDYDSAEIVTSDGDYNRVDFQGKKQKVITGSEYDVAEVTTDNAESDDVRPGTSAPIKVGGGNYDLAKALEP